MKKLAGRPQINLTDIKIGRWRVIRFSGKKGKAYQWYCRCDCGTERNVNAHSLRNGYSRSCGCLQRDMLRKRMSSKKVLIRDRDIAERREEGATIHELMEDFRVSRATIYKAINRRKRDVENDRK